MSKYIKHLFLITSILYSLSFVFWGGYDDKYYWFSHTDFYRDDIMNVLSFFLGSIWKSFFGHNIYAFNLLGWILSLSSILLPYCLLQDYESVKKNVHYLACGIWLMGFWSYQMYSYDSLSMFWFSLLATLTIKTRFETKLSIFAISVVTSFAIASRLPNVVAIAPVLLYVIISNLQKKKPFFLCVSAYVILTILTYTLIVYLFTSQINVPKTIIDSFTYIKLQLGDSHDFVNMIRNYYHNTIFALNSIPLFVLLLMCLSCIDFKDENRKLFILGIATLWLLFCCKFERSNWQIFYSFIIITVCILLAFKEVSKARKNILLFIALFIPLPAMGSDTGLMKMYLLATVFTPLLLILLSESIRSNKYRDILKKILVLFLLYSTLTSYSTFPNALKADKMTEKLRSEIYDYQLYGAPNKTIFYGKIPVHRLYYETGTPMLYNHSFYQKESNEHEKALILSMMEKDSLIVLFDFSKSKSFETKLKRKDYCLIKNNESVTIYKKK